jgi:hypothetical protein
MKASGCSFNGGSCHQIVEACSGCDRGKEYPTGWYCGACPDPQTKWRNGNCNMATHVTAEVKVDSSKKINPLKASKRSKR